jgi:K+-sensing histidine kinase KdpD
MLFLKYGPPYMNKKQLSPVSNSFVVRYGTAALLTLAALILTLLIWSVVKSLASPLFLAAISVSAWKKGFGAGIFATVLSGFAIDYYFTDPEFEFVANPQEITRIFIFALEGVVLCWLISGRTDLRSSRVATYPMRKTFSMIWMIRKVKRSARTKRALHTGGTEIWKRLRFISANRCFMPGRTNRKRLPT